MVIEALELVFKRCSEVSSGVAGFTCLVSCFMELVDETQLVA